MKNWQESKSKLSGTNYNLFCGITDHLQENWSTAVDFYRKLDHRYQRPDMTTRIIRIIYLNI